MEHYKKGKNVEEEITKDNLPFFNLNKEFLWIHVKGGSRIGNLVEFAEKNILETKTVIWTGCGAAVGKTITCVEVLKRQFKAPLYQMNRCCCKIINEYWDPLLPELEQLVVKRRLPVLHVMLSMEPFPTDDPGYQAPNLQTKKVECPKFHRKPRKKQSKEKPV